MLENKKGSLEDIMFIGIILLFAAMVILIGFKVTSEFNDNVQTNDLIPANAKTSTQTLTDFYPGIVDNSFLFLTIGLCIATLVLAALVRIHPMFIAFYLIGLTIVVFVSGVLSNIYQEMAANANLAAQADQLTVITSIIEYLPFIIGIFGTLLMVVMYKLWRNGEE